MISETEQEILKSATIAIPGMGGVGGAHLVTLARMGVGNFHIADGDRYELANFNRQYGASLCTLGQTKTEVMNKIVKDINPEVQLKVWDEFITAENVESFLKGCDLAIDGLDSFAIDARRIFYRKARAMGIPVISAGPVGFEACVFIVTPESIGFDDYFDLRDGMSEREKLAKFIVGLSPSLEFIRNVDSKRTNMKERHAPSIAFTINLCTGLAGAEAMKILLKRGRVRPVPHYYTFDTYRLKFKRGFMPFGNKNPIQFLKYLFVKRSAQRLQDK